MIWEVITVTIEEILKFDEMQIFDRKSINIAPRDLAKSLVAFANADGGMIAIGISDANKRIEGIDYEVSKLNELLRVPFDFCCPTIPVTMEKVACVDYKGRENHVLLMHIEPSAAVHTNQADEVFLRIGDKSKLLKFDERLQLTYDKGERYFEDKAVPDADIDDIDISLVRDYIDKIGYTKTPEEYLEQNKGFIKCKDGIKQISVAAILLFGKNPQKFFPRARIRFIKYDGVEEKFGTEMNVIKDVIFEGTVLKIINDAVGFLDTQIKEKTYLGKEGTFVTDEEYPKFVRQELIVNAVTHRAYNITGTDIQIKMFDDRIVVESPGKLPGLVKPENIRTTHFSRNPKIAEYLKAYRFVREYGEGVNRMCNELEEKGMKMPEYRMNAFMLQTTVFSSMNSEKPAIEVIKPAINSKKPAIDVIKSAIENKGYKKPTQKNIILVYSEIDSNQIFGINEVKKILQCADSTARAIIAKMRDDIKIIIPVSGKGKGKYRFIDVEKLNK